MSDYSQILDSKSFLKLIPRSLLSKYKYIKIEASIQGGKPHIKGTRVVAFDVFIAQMEKISLDQLILEYKSMGTIVSKDQLREAFEFTSEIIASFIHDQKTSKASK